MLAVAGGKGGAGKTTTTLGLAGALARQRRTVVAADADREMPDLHAMAGVAREPGLDAVAAGWPAGLVAGAAGPPTPGVDVVPAASGPPDARREDSDLGSPLAGIRGCADAVLLDCPAGAGPDAVAPLRAADAAVVVTTPEPACLRDAAKTAAMARELDTPVAGAVLSRTGDPPGGVGRLLDCPVLGVVPDAGVRSAADVGTSGAEPLASDGVRAAHDRIVSALRPKYL
ncbi:MinD/ParA family ATP-binding protein [Halorussus sp. AFM4]|uniref:MinD/ParA family ATP-binding protein n=1 Tax=Halorussus sp. AFM4 TaxID=3421651 RepID=UPI003EC08587